MLITDAIDRHQTYLKGQGRSPATAKFYRVKTARFLKFCEDTGIADLDQLTPEIMDAFSVMLHETEQQFVNHHSRDTIDKPLALATISAYLRGPKLFLAWCHKRGHMAQNMAQHLNPPSWEVRPDERVMSRRDFGLMLDEATRAATEEGNLRDLALFSFIADTGCRRGEVSRLKIKDLNLDKREARVTGKGRTHVVDFGQRCADILRLWLDLREQMINGRDHGFVFVGINPMHAQSYGQGLTDQAIAQIFKRLGKRAGVKGKCNPHSLRHLVGQSWIDHGLNLEVLRQKLGHADIQTTAQFYSHVDRSRVKAATDLASLVNGWRPER